MCAVRLSPPLISNLNRDVKFKEDTKRFPFVTVFSLNMNILLSIIISQSIATATINSGTSGWKTRGVGVLPYMGYIGMCRCEGYGFQAVYSRIGYINQRIGYHFSGN